MNNYNANDNSEKKSLDGFSCELLRSSSSSIDQDSVSFRDFAAFENWIENELAILESKFAHNMTVNSVRNELTKSR